MASGIYNTFKSEVMQEQHDLDSDSIKVMLLDDNHSFNAAHDIASAVSGNEISGTGYTAGGAALTSLSVSTDNTDNEGVFDAANVSWTNATFSAYHAVVYNATNGNKLICSIDFDGAQSPSNQTFTITWAAEGILNLA